MKQQQLQSLTGVRFLAAFLIVVLHFGQPALASALGTGWLGTAAGRIAASGYTGVNLFFLLSGFILAHTYLTPDGRLRGTCRAFYAARVARIYPVYLLGFVLSIATLVRWAAFAHPIYAAAYRAHPLGVPLAALLLLQSWLPPWQEVVNPPGWSLSVEACFYAAFPFAAVAIARLPVRRLWCALGGLWLLEIAPTAIYALSGAHWGNAAVTALRLDPLIRLPEFLCGVALGRLYLHRAAHGWAGRSSGVALLGLLAAMQAEHLLPFGVVEAGLFDPLFLLLLYGLARGRGGLAGILSTRPLVALGEASYSLYILHWPLWIVWVHAVPRPGSPWYFACYAATAVAAAVLIYRLLEVPAQRAIRRRWATGSRPVSPAPVPPGPGVLAPRP